MKAGLYVNKLKDSGLEVAKKTIELLERAGVELFLFEDLKKEIKQAKYFDFTCGKIFDLLVTIGGDGTILRTVPYCSQNNIPILGINLGTVGFLTEIELDHLEKLPSLIQENAFLEDVRSLLQIEINGKSYSALNEIVVSRKTQRMITLAVEIQDRLADKYFSDGFIVCTPTGSTAYSLSAGGPVISPSASVFGIIPINSHSLHSRPIVISDHEKICVKVLRDCDECEVIADGAVLSGLNSKEPLIIKKSEKSVKFLRLGDNNFYSKLLLKLNSWSVT